MLERRNEVWYNYKRGHIRVRTRAPLFKEVLPVDDRNGRKDLGNTITFERGNDKKTAHEVLLSVYYSLREKGYDPLNQLVGYLLSGDPTYITSHNNARYLIRTLERDELMEELVRAYIEQYGEDDRL